MASSNTVVFCRLNKRTTLSKLDANAGKWGLFRIPRILQWIKAAGQKDQGTQILLPKEGRKVIWRQMEAINFSAKHDDSDLVYRALSDEKLCFFISSAWSLSPRLWWDMFSIFQFQQLTSLSPFLLLAN